ncbi:MAG: sulfatase [Planctomycetaceae bacterium]|nr:sulfatase [Planctomycetaceae bacterium]
MSTRATLILLLTAAVICPAVVSTSQAAGPTPAKRPNFLFILTDDQSPETLSCYGNTVCQTPHIDRLARRGIVLDDAHHMGAWSGAVCTASRTMIMTGRTVWRIPGARGPGLTRNRARRQQAAQNSLPAIFNRAGYSTFRTCKRGNSFREANALFTEHHDATRRGSDPETGSRWHGDRVIEFLDKRQQAGDKAPFLLYMGFSHPHDPRNAPETLARKYGASNKGPGQTVNPKAPPLPVNYLAAHPFHHGHPGLRDEVRVQGVMKRRDPATIRNELGREYACIENIDNQVGRVIKQLEMTGELENTYVVFTSDHGIAVGRHGLTGKQNLYEHTWRVPFIVTGPGIKPGTRASGYIYLLDTLRTFCDLADITPPESVEGRSFRKVLEGKTDAVRDSLYGVYTGGTKPGMRAVKTRRFKLIKYDVLDGKVRRTQLFDLKENPREFLVEHRAKAISSLLGHTPKPQQVNLADDPKYAAKRKELEALLKREMKRLGDPYELTD